MPSNQMPPNDEMPSSEESNLVAFLRQNAPQPPPALPELEDHILAAIEHEPFSQKSLNQNRPRPVTFRLEARSWWLATTAIAASLVVGVISYRSWMPAAPNAAETASLEAFLEDTWHSSINSTDSTDSSIEPEYSLFTDSTTTEQATN